VRFPKRGVEGVREFSIWDAYGNLLTFQDAARPSIKRSNQTEGIDDIECNCAVAHYGPG
jgi:hypothetical protein